MGRAEDLSCVEARTVVEIEVTDAKPNLSNSESDANDRAMTETISVVGSIVGVALFVVWSSLEYDMARGVEGAGSDKDWMEVRSEAQ